MRGSRGSPRELADPIGSLEVGKHEDVEQLGAGSRPERVQALAQSALKLVRPHARRLRCERLESIQRLNPEGQSSQSAASVMVGVASRPVIR